MSAPVLHSIRALTQRSVDRATSSSSTEPTHSAEATENVIRFHSEGILGPHGDLEEATRGRAAIATPPWPSTWVYSPVRVWKKAKTGENDAFFPGDLFHCIKVRVPERRRNKIYGGQRDLLPGEKFYPLCVLHGSCLLCNPLCTGMCLLVMTFSRQISWLGNQIVKSQGHG